MDKKFPGQLWYDGIIAIHADWPIYPSGTGWEIALRNLGNFPEGTLFYEIDDIDRCKLLISEKPKSNINYFDFSYYHVAAWHKDLLDLQRQGLTAGIIEKSDYEFKLMKFQRFKEDIGKNLRLDDEGNVILYIKSQDGQLSETKYQKPVQSQDEELPIRDCAIIIDYVGLTPKGIEMLSTLAKNTIYSKQLSDLVEPLIRIKRFDTAIRDASLLIETSIKKFYSINLFGQRLIDFHIQDIIKHNDNFNSAAIKCYRGELRTIFKFIRNDFAHNFRIVSESQCRVILQRIDSTLIEFGEVINAYYK